jgi:hypothetical protein
MLEDFAVDGSVPKKIQEAPQSEVLNQTRATEIF